MIRHGQEGVSMNTFDARTEAPPHGLSRRRLLTRAAGGLAGALLAPLGLIGGRSEVRAARVVSLGGLVQQISPNCNPSHGIRLLLPDDAPVISLLDIIRRFYHG
jgi:hypothetical protein